MKQQNLIMVISVAIVVGIIGFFGGMKYQSMQSSRNGFAGNFNGGVGQFQNRRGGTGINGAGRNGFRPVVGEILNQDNKSLTVKMADGSSKIVILSTITTVSKTTAGALADLKVGDTVAVNGIQNTDGSITAENIQLNPQFRGMGDNASGSSGRTGSPDTR